jgi:hypothetical protein
MGSVYYCDVSLERVFREKFKQITVKISEYFQEYNYDLSSDMVKLYLQGASMCMHAHVGQWGEITNVQYSDYVNIMLLDL